MESSPTFEIVAVNSRGNEIPYNSNLSPEYMQITLYIRCPFCGKIFKEDSSPCCHDVWGSKPEFVAARLRGDTFREKFFELLTQAKEDVRELEKLSD